MALEEDYGEVLTGEGKHYLGRIRAGVQRMGQLIDALLQLSRITRSEMVVESVGLSELAQEVAQELEEQLLPGDSPSSLSRICRRRAIRGCCALC